MLGCHIPPCRGHAGAADGKSCEISGCICLRISPTGALQVPVPCSFLEVNVCLHIPWALGEVSWLLGWAFSFRLKQKQNQPMYLKEHRGVNKTQNPKKLSCDLRRFDSPNIRRGETYPFTLQRCQGARPPWVTPSCWCHHCHPGSWTGDASQDFCPCL